MGSGAAGRSAPRGTVRRWRATREHFFRWWHPQPDAAGAGRAVAGRGRAPVGIRARNRDHTGGQPFLGRSGEFRHAGRCRGEPRLARGAILRG